MENLTKNEEVLTEIRDHHAKVGKEEIRTFAKTRSIIDLRKSVMSDRTAIGAIRALIYVGGRK